MKAAILRIEGTNCEEEMLQAFLSVGFEAEHVHLKQLTKDCSAERVRKLFDYDVLMIPGGWSAGDYVRAGAIFAARMKSKLGIELNEFVNEGRIVGGVCNGFQILIELGLLPGFKGISKTPQAALANNLKGFQCRPTYITHASKTPFTEKIKEGAVLQVPVANGEGRLTFGSKNQQRLKELTENDQIVFRYCKPDGSSAKGEFPWNPSGSLSDIAGICNPERNVLGMMPHPERVMENILTSDWTRKPKKEFGDGRMLFESIVSYVKKQ
ncbi:MAG: phosphoribosylformylglycinamidine synthase subunit PurQ [Candidatus Altiarchaeota archaeon]